MRARAMTLAAALMVAVALAAGTAAAVQTAQGSSATAALQDPQGKQVGQVKLIEVAKGFLVMVEVEGLQPGEHGFHIHETGKCDPPDFKTAGGHLNPTKAAHGFDNPKGPHAGDLPNIHVPSSGRLTLQFFLAADRLPGGLDALLGGDGASVMVHSGPDDYRTDPAGHSGDRIACGVLGK